MKHRNIQKVLGIAMAVVLSAGSPGAVLAENTQEISVTDETDQEAVITSEEDLPESSQETAVTEETGTDEDAGLFSDQGGLDLTSEETLPEAGDVSAAEQYLIDNYVNQRIVEQEDDCARKREDGTYEIGTHDRIGVAVQELILKKEPTVSKYKVCWFVNHKDVIKRYEDTGGSNYPYVDYIDRVAASGDSPSTNSFQLNYYRKEDCDVPYMAFFPDETHTFTVTAKLYQRSVKDSEMLDGTAQPLASHDFTFYHLSWHPGLTRFRVSLRIYGNDTQKIIPSAKGEVYKDGERVVPFISKSDGKLLYNLTSDEEYEVKVPALDNYYAVDTKITFKQDNLSVNMIPHSYQTSITCVDALDEQPITNTSITVWDSDGKKVKSGTDRCFYLSHEKTYTYKATAEGYEDAEGFFTIPLPNNKLVIKMGSQDAITLGKIREKIWADKATQPLKPLYGKNTSIVDMMQKLVDSYTDVNDGKEIQVTGDRSFDKSLIASDGTILYRKSDTPQKGSDLKTMNYTFAIKCGKETIYVKREVLVSWDSAWLTEKVREEAASLDWEQIHGENTTKSVVTENLDLPGSLSWSNVSWTSDQPEILTITQEEDRFTGKVTRPARNTKVTLKALCSLQNEILNNELDDPDAVSPAEQEITVTVAGTEDGELDKAVKEAQGSENPPIPSVTPVPTEAPIHEHRFGKWTTVSKATVSAPEVQQRVCSCGKKETRNYGKKLTPSIKVNVSGITLKLKQKTAGVKVTGLARGDSIKSWKSGNTKIAKVSDKGVITAQKKAGSTSITVTLKSGKTAVIKVKVQKETVKTTKISGLSKNLTIKKGKSLTLKPVISPFTSGEKVTYTTSNKKIATVTSKGKITAKKKGSVNIIVRSGKKAVKIKVTVK